MTRTCFLPALFALVAACSSKSKPPDATGGGGGGDEGGGGGGGGGDGDTAVKCEPGRCLEDIRKLIAERRPDARACYDSARKKDPKLGEGKIIVNFAIDSEGVVGETSQGMQDGQIEDQAIVGCISEVIKTVRFAKSPAGKTTRAYHRFEFSP